MFPTEDVPGVLYFIFNCALAINMKFELTFISVGTEQEEDDEVRSVQHQ